MVPRPANDESPLRHLTTASVIPNCVEEMAAVGQRRHGTPSSGSTRQTRQAQGGQFASNDKLRSYGNDVVGDVDEGVGDQQPVVRELDGDRRLPWLPAGERP